MRVTLKDIAEKTGFSITTVSRALGGFDDVNENTRQQIVQVADDMGYQPNVIARQLRDRRTNTIGVISPMSIENSEDDFFNILIKGIAHAAALHHYDLLISAQLPDGDEMAAYRRIAGGNRVDGMIVARTYVDDPRIAYLQSINHPFVVSGRRSPDEPSDFPYIDMDSQAGIRMLVDHFVEYGHREIGLLMAPEDVAFNGFRIGGYREGLEAAELPFRDDYIVHHHLRRDGGDAAAHILLDRHPHITAIIACNDLMALGAMNAIQERGLQVGAEIAVAGFDDIPTAKHNTPSLTTVHQPIFEIGERLTNLLLSIISKEAQDTSATLLQPTLIVRESSGPRRP